jgi:23S rRNA (cytidine1920-2'-O)/16S rRNA (cytidine1409-2'-O)-methyltransferase
MIKSKFVSRAGEKLEHAIKEFNLKVSDKVCADFGSSTGGFVDCLLGHNAAKVYSIDTSYGTLEWKLRNNPKVIVLERTNALHIKLPEKCDLITIDVGWTPQKLILPNAKTNIKPKGEIITLIKPHYETKNKNVLTPKDSELIFNQTLTEIKQIGFEVINTAISPIKGKRGGNTEYLAYLKLSG